MHKIILIIIVILLAIGFLPYKLPRYSNHKADKELLVGHEEATCSAAMYVLKGELNIPADLKPFFSDKPTELNIDSTGKSMFDPINKDQNNWWLITDNQFVIAGAVTGVDRSDYKYCRTYYPIYKIDNWWPTTYHANFWTFSRPVFYGYFITVFALVIMCIILFFVRKPWKRKA